jgi:hypothetical protein
MVGSDTASPQNILLLCRNVSAKLAHFCTFDTPGLSAQQRLGSIVRDLSRRLQRYPHAPQIISVRQHGYRLIMPLTRPG